MSYSPPSSAKPFSFSVSEQDLSDFKQLLHLSKIGPHTFENHQEDRRFGVTHKWLSDAKDYWLNKYDWRAAEKRINSFPNYTMDIEDVNVHFIALFSQKKDAVPIVFLHGWPGSFIEFLPMASLIKDKYNTADQPYHIIIASLPGYPGSSVLPIDKDYKIQDTARVVHTLMKNLGFNKYIAQGGDIGSLVSRILSDTYVECIGIHVNFLRTELPDEKDEMTVIEQRACKRAAEWRERGTAYGLEHSTRPGTIGLVLSSSPIALLAWIGEKFLEWTEEDPSLDTILTNVSLYWFTQAYPRSIYPYRMIMGGNRKLPDYLQKPTGFSFFPYELFLGSKKLIEKQCNLVSYKAHEHGGHFAALERPQDLLEDVEEFVKLAWKV